MASSCPYETDGRSQHALSEALLERMRRSREAALQKRAAKRKAEGSSLASGDSWKPHSSAGWISVAKVEDTNARESHAIVPPPSTVREPQVHFVKSVEGEGKRHTGPKHARIEDSKLMKNQYVSTSISLGNSDEGLAFSCATRQVIQKPVEMVVNQMNWDEGNTTLESSQSKHCCPENSMLTSWLSKGNGTSVDVVQSVSLHDKHTVVGTRDDEVTVNSPSKQRPPGVSVETGTGAVPDQSVEATPATLSDQQMQVLKALAQKMSVFVTGSAGTGKSFLLSYAIRQLRMMHGSEYVHITASTGLAACAIGGSTLHSFAGIGLGESKADILLSKVLRTKELRRRWTETRALIIDEISMIDGPLLDKLDFIARGVRRCEDPFGGIQLLVTGDFFQLPPVSKGSQDKAFAFDAQCWQDCFQLQVELTRVFRQKDDAFVKLLNEIRKGRLTPEASRQLWDRVNAAPDSSIDDGIVATKLYPYRVDVASENVQRLRELRGQEMAYTSLDDADDDYAVRRLEDTRAEKVLHLRIGAQVMLLKNLDTSRSLVNGSRGIVVRFVSTSEDSTGEHRRHAATVGSCGYWPVVMFACDGKELLMGPEEWTVERNGQAIAKRTQLPLSLAWAISVHKCQGMTLDRVRTDLSKAFDYGMVYVALSRVRSLGGLHLLGFDPKKIRVHPKVERFYSQF